MSKAPAKPPTSSLAAFLNALSWSRKDPDFDAGLKSSSAWTEALTTPEGVARTSRAEEEAIAALSFAGDRRFYERCRCAPGQDCGAAIASDQVLLL